MSDTPPFPSLRTLLRRAWSVYTRHPMLLSAACAAYLGITAIGLWLPLLNLAFLFAGVAPLTGGLFILLRNAHHGTPRPGDLIQGFREIERWIGVYWCWVLSMVLPFFPLAIGVFLSTRFPAEPWRWYPAYATLALSLFIAVLVLTRFVYALPLAAQQPRSTSVSVLFAHSGALVDGRFWTSLGMFTLLVVLGLSGLLVAGIGVLVTLPLALLAFQALYDARFAAVPFAPETVGDEPAE